LKPVSERRSANQFWKWNSLSLLDSRLISFPARIASTHFSNTGQTVIGGGYWLRVP
jgi:hypothetical protein